MKKRIIAIFTILFLFIAGIPIAWAQINILGGLAHERKAEPGETYKGEIIIRNKNEGIQEVKIYQTDYLFFYDGSNIYGEPAKIPRSNAAWITFRPKRFKIGPKQQEMVHYTVKVPEDEGIVGTYWSMLMVEPIPKDSPESSQSKKSGVVIGVRQILRYGIQIASHIGDSGSRMLRILDTKLLKEEEKRILKVDIENVGERYLRPSLFVELYDEKGSHVKSYEGGVLRTYPGTSVRFRVDFGQITEGIYKALLVADCGGDDIFGATYNLKIEK